MRSGGGRRRKEEEEEEGGGQADIKSNNPRLTGGKNMLKIRENVWGNPRKTIYVGKLECIIQTDIYNLS